MSADTDEAQFVIGPDDHLLLVSQRALSRDVADSVLAHIPVAIRDRVVLISAADFTAYKFSAGSE